MLGFDVLDAVITDEHLLAARVFVDAVVEGVRALSAVHAVPQLDEARIVEALAELVVHALVKDIHRAFPQAVVTVLFAIADNAAVNLVDLIKTAVFHQRGQDLAANTAGAIGHHRLVLHPVILAGFELGDEIVRGLHVRDDGIFKLANFRLHGIAPIKEDDLLAALLDELVDLFWLEVHAASDDAILIHLELARRAEGHDFIADLDRQAREVIRPALGPLELHLFKARVLAGLAHIALAGIHVTADGAVDAVLRDEDAALEPQFLAQGALPQHDRGGILDGSEAVVEENLANSHARKFRPR